MLRRGFLMGMAGLAIAAPLGVRAQALFRTVVEVSSADPDVMIRALNIVLETGRYHIAYRESAEIRVIAVGEGMAMLRADISPVADRVRFVSRSIPLASWYVASEDIAAVAAETGTLPPLIDGVTAIESGANEADRLQADGWSLIRP